MISVLAVAFGALAISGGSSCPSPDDVSRALEAAERGKDVQSSTMHVELVDGDGGVVLRLRDRSGKELATRTLSRADTSCSDLAQAAAVVITAWQLHSDEWTPEVPRLAPTDAVAVVRHAKPPGPTAVQYELSSAFLSSIASTGAFAAGGDATAAFTKRGARWFGRISIFGTDMREQDLGFGRMAWSRVALAAGAAYRFGTVWQLDLHADAVAALLILRGSATASPTAFNFDPGLRAGIRGMRRWGHVAGFIDVGVVGWLRSQQVNAIGTLDNVEVPRLDVLLTAGVAYEN